MGTLCYNGYMLFFDKKTQEGADAAALCIDGLSPLVSRLLMGRGVRDAAAAQAFLNPDAGQLHDPFAMRDMDAAQRRIRKALSDGEKICIYGDYDVDGVCAASMLYDALRHAGADAAYYIPTRQSEGYGLNMAALETLARDGVKLIVTVDNGISALREADFCYECGMELIVSDHHLCGDVLPRAEAVLCHTRPDDSYPNAHICGAGTAYKLLEALFGREKAQDYLPLAGIATIADVVPLLGENRAFAALALERINARRCQRGILSILESCGMNRRIQAQDIAFGIAPRLNAAGRLADAACCVELLCSRDGACCKEIAAKLETYNGERRREETAIYREACEALDAADLTDRRAIVLQGDWHKGVIGIAASRIAERYYRPVILFSREGDMLTGSARSIPGVHLYAALLQCAELFTRFGGHEAAAGASLPAARYAAFCARFEDAVRFVAPDAKTFLPRRQYELEAALSDMHVGLARELERLAPFGEGNPEPLFCVRNAHLRSLKRIGADGKHINGQVCAGGASRPFVYFGAGLDMEKYLCMDRCELLCELSRNEWRGTESAQLRVCALRQAAIAQPEDYLEAHGEKFMDAISCNILYNKDEDGSAPSPVYVEDEAAWLETAVQEAAMGTLALCLSAQSALRLLQNPVIAAHMDIVFHREPESSAACHAMVLAPLFSRMQPWRYRRILLCGLPAALEAETLRRLARLAPEAALYVGQNRDGAQKLLAGLRFTRETLVAPYKAFMGSGRRFHNREELAEFLFQRTKTPRCLCRAAVEIMLELGFAREKGGIAPVEGAPRAALEQSRTFCCLQELADSL